MRPHRLLLPFALLAPLALASPAVAADQAIDVTSDFTFAPDEVNLDVGDTVTWSFSDPGHTTKSNSGQAESWNSGPELATLGETYTHTFNQPGRFSYYCEPHKSFMKGAVVVGTDKYRKSQTKFKQVRRAGKVTFSFKLVEAAKVVASLKGPNKKKATSKRLKPGRHSLAVRGLKKGRYKGTVSFTDDFGKVSKVRVSVKVS
jgi:plastocyanin